MNTIAKTVFLHLLSWFVLSAVFFYFSEAITKKLFTGYDNVELWLIVLISGLAIITIIVSIALAIKLWRRKKPKT